VEGQEGGRARGWKGKRVEGQEGGRARGWKGKRVEEQEGGRARGWKSKRVEQAFRPAKRGSFILALATEGIRAWLQPCRYSF
jgi:hypothetical protein